MRESALIGSGVAVVLLAAAVAVGLRGGLAPAERTVPPTVSASRTEPAPQRADRPAAVAPSFDVVKIGPTGSAVIAGRAAPGAKVTVLDGGKALGEVAADGRGEWVLIPAQPLAAGNRVLSLEAADPQGGSSVKSEETVALSIAPPASAGRTGVSALAVVLPREGAGAARVLQLPGAARAGTAALSLDAVEYDGQGRVALSGRAAPGAALRIYLGNQLFAAATADSAGRWAAASAQAAPPGRLELRLDQLAANGAVAARVALPLAQPAAAALVPGQTYVVERGNNLWQIARRAYGAGPRYVIIYSANTAQIRDPGRIYPGQIIKLPKS